MLNERDRYFPKQVELAVFDDDLYLMDSAGVCYEMSCLCKFVPMESDLPREQILEFAEGLVELINQKGNSDDSE